MERARIRALVCASLAAAALSGCMASDGGTGDGSSPVARAATSTRLVERDVEAPQVFQVTDQSLWDGRPSLGGVWVASPDAVDPERVIIRNPANGKFVIGALFRRERMNPGPALQISSDAAAALGILAGAPTSVNVTALRREEAGEPAEAPVATASVAPTPAAAPAPAPAATNTSAPVAGASATAIAAAAIDRAEGKPAPAAPDAAVTAAAEPAAPAKPKRKGWLFGKRRAAAEAETAAAATTATGGAIATEATATGVIAGATVTSSALPPSGGATSAPRPAAAPAAPTPAAATPAAPTRGQLIQIGIFSVEANADRALKLLSDKGLPARKLTEQSQGKTFWRVVADPAADSAGTLAKVKAAGFADAYLLRG